MLSLVESSRAGRQMHTRHGLHLNNSGKRWLAEQIYQAVKYFNVETPSTQCSIATTTRELLLSEERCFGKLCLSITQQPSLRKPLTMFQLNIQSIRNKLDSLNLWLDKYTCNILTLSEHWLFSKETDFYISYIFIQFYISVSYKLASSFCRDPPLRGGCCIFVRKGLKFGVIL